jgi:hypothetical protein
MKINIEQIAPTFLKQLEQDEFSAQSIIASLSPKDSYKEAVKKIRHQTVPNYSRKTIKRALNGYEEPPKISSRVTIFVDWLKSQRRKHWILEADDKQQNEKLLAKDLTELSEGKPTDVILFNCLTFEWEKEKDSPGKYPACRVKSEPETSIALFNLPRIQEMTTELAKIGNTEIIVMVPSTEATSERVWRYAQSRQERETIVDEAVDKLNQVLPKPIIANRWDTYLKTRGITIDPDDYSLAGENLLKQLPSFQAQLPEIISGEVEYFQQIGIEVDPNEIKDSSISYFGMYAGEGITMKDIKNKGQRQVVVANFEEFRVAKTTLAGAQGQLSIITPTSDKEMTAYYKWKNEIQKSKKLQLFK